MIWNFQDSYSTREDHRSSSDSGRKRLRGDSYQVCLPITTSTTKSIIIIIPQEHFSMSNTLKSAHSYRAPRLAARFLNVTYKTKSRSINMLFIIKKKKKKKKKKSFRFSKRAFRHSIFLLHLVIHG